MGYNSGSTLAEKANVSAQVVAASLGKIAAQVYVVTILSGVILGLTRLFKKDLSMCGEGSSVLDSDDTIILISTTFAYLFLIIPLMKTLSERDTAQPAETAIQYHDLTGQEGIDIELLMLRESLLPTGGSQNTEASRPSKKTIFLKEFGKVLQKLGDSSVCLVFVEFLAATGLLKNVAAVYTLLGASGYGFVAQLLQGFSNCCSCKKDNCFHKALSKIHTGFGQPAFNIFESGVHLGAAGAMGINLFHNSDNDTPMPQANIVMWSFIIVGAIIGLISVLLKYKNSRLKHMGDHIKHLCRLFYFAINWFMSVLFCVNPAFEQNDMFREHKPELSIGAILFYLFTILGYIMNQKHPGLKFSSCLDSRSADNDNTHHFSQAIKHLQMLLKGLLTGVTPPASGALKRQGRRTAPSEDDSTFG